MLVLAGSIINGKTKISYHTSLKAVYMETPQTFAIKAMSRLLQESAERQDKESHGLRNIAATLQLQAESTEREIEADEICSNSPCRYCKNYPCGTNNHTHPDCEFIGIKVSIIKVAGE